MSDSEDSTITYTAVSSPFADLPDIGSPGFDGPPVMPEDPYAYVLVYPEFMPPEDKVLPAEEQPLHAAVLPTSDSSGYVPESDPKEDPEEDDDEDPEEDPADGGDDGDDEDESSDNDEDDDVDIEGDEEEEEHPAPADSTAVALPVVDQATPPPHLAYRFTARISIRDEPPTPFWSDTEVARLLVIPTPPPSPLSPWSSPLPQIPFPPLPSILSPLPLSPPLPISSPSLPASPTYPLGYRAAMIWLRAEALVDRLEVTLPPRKRLGIALGLRYEVGESLSAHTARPPRGFRVDYGFVATMDREIIRDLERDVGYGIIDTRDEMLVDMPGEPATDDTELGRRMTKFTTRVRQDTDEIYMRLDDDQSGRQLMVGQLNMLYRDRRVHARTTRLMEAEERMYRED
ncbi:hypothetical protein Tco_0599889 [Tanacetum coccineum]